MPKVQKCQSVRLDSTSLHLLLTDSELEMVNQRFAIVKLRKDGLSIREIARNLRAGTDTITRVIKIAKHKGLLPGSEEPGKKLSKWVFGKVSVEE